MRILLISPNREKRPDPVFPLGLGYLAAAVKARGWPVRISDLCFSPDWKESLLLDLRSFNPDYIGLSIRNVDNVTFPATVSYLPFIKEVLRVCREASAAPIILGGSGFTLMPALILQYLKADYGIVGEGEKGLVVLLERLSRHVPVEKLSGLIPDHSGQSIEEREASHSLDRLSQPDRDLFDLKAYLSRGAMGNLQTKRGCPFQCIYCTYPLIEGKKIRLRAPGAVADEIETMVSIGLDHLFFVDNNFNYPPEQAQGICREIRSRRLSLRWTAYVNPGFISESLVEDMKASGCRGLELGIDSASPRQLEALGKNFTLEAIRDAARICRQGDLPFCFSLLLGGPGETLDTVRETLEQVQALEPTAVICMTGIRIFPGTRLAGLARQEGLIGRDWDPLQPTFYLSRAVEDSLQQVLKDFSRDQPNWVFPGLGIDLDPLQAERMHKLGLKGPLWVYLKLKKRGGTSPAA